MSSALSKRIAALCFALLVILAGCAPAPNAPVRMLTGTAAREDNTTSTSFTELVPTPGEVLVTSATSTLTALFVTECRVTSPGQTLEVRIKVDDQVADPGVAVLTMSDQYATHSHLGFKTNVAPGEHKVTVEWRVSEGTGFVRNRSFTVWEVKP